MNNILVINVNWLGDVVFSSPVFKALKVAYPNAKISCLGVPRVRDVLESIEGIDEVIVYDEKGRDWGLIGKIKLVMRLRRGKFDAAFLLHRSMTRALIVFLAGIPVRIGYDAKKRGGLLTQAIAPAPASLHRLDVYANVIEKAGIPVADRHTRLKVDLEGKFSVGLKLEQYGLKADERFIVLNPGGNWDLKRWPVENFIKLAQLLLKELPHRVIITGASKDETLAQRLFRGTGSSARVVNLAGQTTLKEMTALLQKAAVVVSVDSGPIHLATSVGAKVVAIFGPTRPELTGPRGIGQALILQKDVGCNRNACYYLQCPDNVCMQSVTVKDVFDAVKSVVR